MLRQSTPAKFIEATPTSRLVLVPSPDDEPVFSAEYQKILSDFYGALKLEGVEASARMRAFDAAGAVSGLTGEFILTITALASVVTPIATLTGAWLHARLGRKVRLKIGDVEAEAQTVEDVKRLLDQAEQLKRRNSPKMIISNQSDEH
jgi:hypothetical protein